MKTPLAILVCLALLAGLAGAQFIQNGDFSNGMKNWTGSGNGANPQTGQPHGTTPVTEKFDTNGGGLSPAFSILPGGNTNQNPNNPPYILSQQALVVNGPMEMHLDVCLTGPRGNAQGGWLKIKIAGTQVASWKEFSGSFTAGTYRRHLTFNFTPPKAGRQKLDIEIWRERYVWSWGSPTSHTPKMVIDNIFLAPAQQPLFLNKGERKLGGTLALELQGKAGSAGAVLMGLQKGPGIGLPGFSGSLQLDVTKLLVLLGTGPFDKSGSYTLNVPIPNDPAIAGYPLPFQGIEVGTAGGHISHLHELPLYP